MSRCHPFPAFLARLPLTLGVMAAAWLLLLGGGNAEASCGDWLAGHQRPTERPSAIAETDLAPPEATASDTDRSAPRPRRCEGPACRGVPKMPATPVDSTVDAPRSDQADFVAAALGLVRAAVGPRPRPSDEHPVPTARSVPIRPPRLAVASA